MSVVKLIKYDMREGYKQAGVKLIGIVFITLFSCIEFYIEKENYNAYAMEIIGQATSADYLCYLLEGMHPFRPEIESTFLIPIRWLFLHMFLLYAILYYPYRDLTQSIGGVLVVKSGSRKKWWFSKCLWTVTYIFCAYAIMMVTVILFCGITGEKISAYLSPQVIRELMDTQICYTMFPLEVSILIFCLPLFITIVFSWLQMFLGLFIKPLFAYGMILAVCLASAYCDNVLLIGNYAMPIRSVYFVEQGYTLSEGMTVSLFAGILFFFVGSFAFSHYDIFKVSEM